MNQNSATPPPDLPLAGKRSWWRIVSKHFASGLLVLIVGGAATLSAAYLQYLARISEAGRQFNAWSEEHQQQLTRAIDSHVEVLYGVRALFDSSEYVTPEEFDRFVRGAVKRHTHMRSLGFLRSVTHAQRAQFEEHYSRLFGTPFVISDPGPDGKPVRAPARAAYVPLVYVQGRDLQPVGIDALANPQMPAVVEALRRGGAASAVISSLPENGQIKRFVHIYLPVFDRDDEASADDASAMPYGFVRVRLVLEEMLAQIEQEATAAGIEVILTEPHDGEAPHAASEVSSASEWDLSWSEDLLLADRTLRLEFHATPAYHGHPRFLSSWPLLLVGSLVTLLGAAGAIYLTGSRARLQDLTQSLLIQVRERRLSEQRTAQSEERYRVLIENSPDAILLLRERGVVFVNRMAIQMLGAQTDADLVGCDILDLVHADYHDIAHQRIASMRRDQQILPPIEERMVRLDGSIVEVEVRSIPFLSDGVQMLQITIRDITERRRAERERAGLEAALRQSQRLEAIGTLTGGIAHDFNNILSSIVGNIQLLLDDLPAAHPARQSAHEIRSATNRARDLVKRLMAFSREQEAPMTSVELLPLIEEVQQLLRPTLPPGVGMRLHVPADVPPVMGNATQLHQVLVNLCTNAAQAMPAGQGQIDILVSTLSADEASRRANTALSGARRYVCLEVRDNGSGIAPEIVDRIFEPFFTTKSAGEGSGLGLAVVHGIVQSHKGAIGISSRLDSGTSFYVFLPASDVPAQARDVEAKPPARGENQHVLYVDDEEPLVFLVTRVLERSGYRCTGCTDPQRAVEIFREDPDRFDLVITDMNMPGISGIDVARQVLELRPQLPVVITSGYIRASDIAATKTLGVRDLILKPDTIEELAAVVGRFLEQPLPAV